MSTLGRSFVAATLATACLAFVVRDRRAAAETIPLGQVLDHASTSPARGSLLGSVLDDHGDPIPGARIRLLGDSGEELLEARTSADTDGDLALGEFRMDDLPAGRYTIVAEFAGVTSAPIRIPVAAWEDTRVRLHVGVGY